VHALIRVQKMHSKTWCQQP